MAKKDIYKIDNYFITIGVLFLIVGLTSILFDPRTYNDVTIRNGDNYKFDNKNGRTLEQIKAETGADEVTEPEFPLIRTIMAVNGLILLIIGIDYRKRENKIITVWNALERTGEGKVNNLAMSLGLDRAFILKHLRDINSQQGAYYVWDESTDKIVDGKLMTEFLVVVDCKNCGSKVDEKVSIELLSLPKCKYCGSPVSSPEDMNKLKKEILLTHEVASIPAKEFNVAIFVGLLFLFWPGAVFYIIKQKT